MYVAKEIEKIEKIEKCEQLRLRLDVNGVNSGPAGNKQNEAQKFFALGTPFTDITDAKKNLISFDRYG